MPSSELLEFLQRLLGWSSAQRREVERAIRDVGELADGRAALSLLGKGSLLSVARRLHRLTHPDRPFIALAPDEQVTDAIERAADGMLYFDARDNPRAVERLAVLGPESRARLVVSAERAEEFGALMSVRPRIVTIRIPPLSERSDEIARLIEAYGRDAMASLNAPALGFRPRDLERLCGANIRTLDEIEDAARRLVALRNWGVTGGAKRLGITHGALSRWARRRRIAT